MKYYLILIRCDIDPYVYGPYKTEEEQDKMARWMKKKHGDEHGIFPACINKEGKLSMSFYSNGFFSTD